MTAEFTAEEQARLAPFFTNLDRSTFGLKLPQEVAGALFSRYSRLTKSLRRTFLDEFLGDPTLGLSDLLSGQAEPAADSTALKKARAFYERVLVGYGDDSVAQLGGAHLACENISNVAAKLLEDARIGIAPLEKSTRYVRFDQKDAAGNYLFYREPKIMASRHRDAYLEVMNLLFDTYSRQMEPMLASIAKALPIEQLEVRDPATGKAGQPGPAVKSVADGRDEEIYNEALAREFDIRHYLTTNQGEACAVADAVAKLKAQGKGTQQAVDEVIGHIRAIPGFEQRPADEGKWWADLTVAAREAAQARMKRAWGGAEE